MNICVFGSANEDIKNIYKDCSESLGEELARRGHTLVFGGGKFGLMGAALRGVIKAEGKSIGVSPEFFKGNGVLAKNCTEFYFTSDMRSRKALMEEKSDAFIVLPGGIGTYEEFFEIYTLLRLRRINKPIALFNIDGYFDSLFEMLEFTAKQGFMDEQSIKLLFFSGDKEKILNYIEKTVKA